MRWLKFTLASCVVVVAGVVAALKFGDREVQRLHQRVEQLEVEKTRLVEYAQRLSASRRVAQVDVWQQRIDADGRVVNTLVWQEIGPSGVLGRAQLIETIGELAYFEALVLKFDHALVGGGDEQRSTSLAMFRRVFGDGQAPESAREIDRETGPFSSGADDPAVGELWQRFWDFVDDPDLASRYGVRVAQIEAPAVPVQPGQVWEVRLDAAGGLNIRKLGERTPIAPTDGAALPVSNAGLP